MLRTPPATIPYDHVREYYAARLRAPGAVFRAAVAETLTDWRLGRASQPLKLSSAEAIFREGVAEIIELRLRAAYAPLFRNLQRIENSLAIFVAIRDDPYAPPPKKPRA